MGKALVGRVTAAGRAAKRLSAVGAATIGAETGQVIAVGAAGTASQGEVWVATLGYSATAPPVGAATACCYISQTGELFAVVNFVNAASAGWETPVTCQRVG